MKKATYNYTLFENILSFITFVLSTAAAIFSFCLSTSYKGLPECTYPNNLFTVKFTLFIALIFILTPVFKKKINFPLFTFLYATFILFVNFISRNGSDSLVVYQTVRNYYFLLVIFIFPLYLLVTLIRDKKLKPEKSVILAVVIASTAILFSILPFIKFF